MKSSFACAAVLCLSLGLAACEGSAAGNGCATAADVAQKTNILTDSLRAHADTGKMAPALAGEIAAQIMAAGRTKGADAKCVALDKVRATSGL